jgi:DNA uptake protein ComE-like DNA-binding protein
MVKTPAQRAGLAILGLLLGVFVACKWLYNPATVDTLQHATGARTNELQQAVDPNTADETALASIPGLTIATAKNIVQYRENLLKNNPDEPPFKSLKDLDPVKGVGPATLKKIEPFLYFP